MPFQQAGKLASTLVSLTTQRSPAILETPTEMAVTGRMLIRWRRKTRAWSRSAFDWQGPCTCDDLCQLSAAVLLKQSGILLSEAHWTSCVSSFSLFPHHHPHPPTSLYMLVRWCFILLIPFFFCLFSFRLPGSLADRVVRFSHSTSLSDNQCSRASGGLCNIRH